MKKLLSWAWILLLSCCEEQEVKPFDFNTADSYLIFGHFYGECMGESCVEIFILTDSDLREDVNDNYRTQDRNFSFATNRNDKLEQVKELLAQLPDALDNEPEVIGCPDCSDGGGLYIEIKSGGEIKHWSIDIQRTPDNLIEFRNLVIEKIALLQ